MSFWKALSGLLNLSSLFEKPESKRIQWTVNTFSRQQSEESENGMDFGWLSFWCFSLQPQRSQRAEKSAKGSKRPGRPRKEDVWNIWEHHLQSWSKWSWWLRVCRCSLFCELIQKFIDAKGSDRPCRPCARDPSGNNLASGSLASSASSEHETKWSMSTRMLGDESYRARTRERGCPSLLLRESCLHSHCARALSLNGRRLTRACPESLPGENDPNQKRPDCQTVDQFVAVRSVAKTLFARLAWLNIYGRRPFKTREHDPGSARLSLVFDLVVWPENINERVCVSKRGQYCSIETGRGREKHRRS